MAGRFLSWCAVKVHLVDVQVTFSKLAVFGKSELDRDSTTALLVDKIHALRCAGSDLMAGRAVRHFIVHHDQGIARG